MYVSKLLSLFHKGKHKGLERTIKIINLTFKTIFLELRSLAKSNVAVIALAFAASNKAVVKNKYDTIRTRTSLRILFGINDCKTLKRFVTRSTDVKCSF